MNMLSATSPVLNALLNRRTIICIFTGFASGLPLYILIQLVPAWLRVEGVSLKEIGLFTLISLPYTWKFVWAPFLDRYLFPGLAHFFGRRRSWMFASQIGLLIAIACLPIFDPRQHLWLVAGLCTIVAILSATQDIVLDAYRRELLPDNELGLGNAVHVNAYRIAGLVPGSLSLILADLMPWQPVFIITAAFMVIAILMTLSIREPQAMPAPKSLRAAISEPFTEFFHRNGTTQALLILAFMVLYKLGDNMATALSTPFYIDLGFSLTEIGIIAKNAALWPSIIGGILGGILMIRLGIYRALWIFGIVQVISIFGFALLARIGNDPLWLAIVIAFEYFGVGLGTAALVAFIAFNTHKSYSAAQFALLTALATLPRNGASAITGYLVEYFQWEIFFYICALLALPGMILLIYLAPSCRPPISTEEKQAE